MRLFRAIAILLLGTSSVFSAGSYTFGPKISTTTATMTQGIAGTFYVASSSLTITTPTITLNGTTGSIAANGAIIFKGTTPWTDVTGYGATGNGTTNDSTAFQNAINSLSSLGGGEVFVPPPSASYKISNVIMKKGVRLRCQSSQSTILSNISGSPSSVITTNSGTGGPMEIDHCSFQIQNSTDVALNISGVNDVHVHDNFFFSPNIGYGTAIKADANSVGGAYHHHFTDNIILNFSTGIWTIQNTSDRIDSNQITASSVGIALTGTSGGSNVVDTNLISAFTVGKGTGVIIGSGGGERITSNYIQSWYTGVQLLTPTTANMLIDNTWEPDLINNVVDNLNGDSGGSIIEPFLGRFGFGVIPSYPVHFYRPAGANFIMTMEQAGDLTPRFRFKTNGVERGDFAIDSVGAHIYTGTGGGTERLKVDASGNVLSYASSTASAFFGDGTTLTGIMTSATNQTISGVKTFTSSVTFANNAFSVGASTFVVNASSVGIRTANPALGLDVNSAAQFGFGATRSTFSATGALTLASNAALTLSGANGNIVAGSSITGSAFYGDGANLTYSTPISSFAASGSLSGTFANTTLGACIAGSTITITLPASCSGIIQGNFNGAAFNATINAQMQAGIIVDGAFVDGETNSKGYTSVAEFTANEDQSLNFSFFITGLTCAQHNVCLSLLTSTGTGNLDGTTINKIKAWRMP